VFRICLLQKIGFLEVPLNKVTMTTTAIRKKVHQFIDEAEADVLEVVYKVLKLHSHHNSILTAAQKQELDKTLAERKLEPVPQVRGA